MTQLAYPQLLPKGRIRIQIRAEGPGGLIGDADFELRRGQGWVQVEAPYHPEGSGETEPPETALLRLQKSEGTWKLERLRVLRKSFDGKELR